MELMVADQQPDISQSLVSAPATGPRLFHLTEEEYEQRPDNARKFLRQLRVLREKREKSLSKPIVETNLSPLFPGQRCEVLALGGVRGEIVSLSQRPNAKGEWIGVKLDEPLGNATVPGCPDGYGCYLSTTHWESKLLVGDFPPVDLMDFV